MHMVTSVLVTFKSVRLGMHRVRLTGRGGSTLRRLGLQPLNRIFVPELLEFRVASNYDCI